MIETKIPELAAVREKLHGPSLLHPPVQRLLRSASSYATRKAAGDAPRDTGATASSLVAETHGLVATIRSRHPGALAEEFGRRASSRQPPTVALVNWASRHGLAGLEFVIARAIARRGIKGRFFVKRALKALHDMELPRLLAQAGREIGEAWRR